MVSTLGKFPVPKKLIRVLYERLNLRHDMDISYVGNRVKDFKHGEIVGRQAFLVDSENGWFILRADNTFYSYCRSRFCRIFEFNKDKLVNGGKIEKKKIGSHILPINAIYKFTFGNRQQNRPESWRRSVDRQIKKDMSRICPSIFQDHLDFLQTVIAEYSSQSENFVSKDLLKIVDLFKKEEKAYAYWMDRGFEGLIENLINFADIDADIENEDITDEQIHEYIRQTKIAVRDELVGEQLSSFNAPSLRYYPSPQESYRMKFEDQISNMITSDGVAVVINEYVDDEWFEERKIPVSRFIQSDDVTIFKDSKDYILWKLSTQRD